MKKKRLWLRPRLSEAHLEARVRFVLGKVDDPDAAHPKYNSLMDIVHVDEKWFYLFHDGRGVLVAPGEELPPNPMVQHKSHIPKAMFIAVSARPQPLLKFDGKVAIHCCTEMQPAQRTTKNHKRGELKEIDMPVDAAYYSHVMETYIMPSIVDAMPWAGRNGRTLIIQHDGAKAHTGKGNSDNWPAVARRAMPGRRVKVVVQPAQSPDLNTLDMGFFNSLQTLADDTDPESLSELLDNVENCYWNYPSTTLERVWAMQYDVYNCILRGLGSNGYDLNSNRADKREQERREGEGGMVEKRALAAALRKYPPRT